MFQGELEKAIFIGNDLYELLIIKLIYLNSGGVADKRRAKANRAATVDARKRDTCCRARVVIRRSARAYCPILLNPFGKPIA